MTTKVIKGFMNVLCVILCLIIPTTAYAGSISTTAYAGSILWSSKHVITNLAKDEEWLLSATTEDCEDIDDVEATASDIEDSEADSEADPEADPEADSVAFIDATLVMEGTEAVPLEITMDSSTTDEIQEDEGLGDGVKEGVEHTASDEDGVEATPNDIQEYAAPEDGVDEIGSQTNP